MTSSSQGGVLLDCDYIIALSVTNESTHEHAKALAAKLDGLPQHMLRIVLFELATVFSRKFNHAMAVDMVGQIRQSDVQILEITELEEKIWQEFYAYNRKSTSFFDCANLVVAKHFGLKIASFDSFYPKALRA